MERLDAPFPWFGGKSRVAPLVWSRFGAVNNYVEPFFGSGAILLGRPGGAAGTETVNDLDGFVANTWRSIRSKPEETADWADRPVNENDLHAIHSWLVNQEFRAQLEGDPDWCDPKIAGWWLWGICCWIGSGFCSGSGPWHVIDGKLVNVKDDAGRGVNRTLPHLGSAGQGVNRQCPHLGDAGRGVNKSSARLLEWFGALSERMARVRVASGDWSRVCGPSVTTAHGLTGVFLDPPYLRTAKRQDDLYRVDSNTVAHAVREWAIANGDNPKMRIALCGYEDEHDIPDSWECVAWKAQGGYASQGDGTNNNNKKERIWFSPNCEKQERLLL